MIIYKLAILKKMNKVIYQTFFWLNMYKLISYKLVENT